MNIACAVGLSLVLAGTVRSASDAIVAPSPPPNDGAPYTIVDLGVPAGLTNPTPFAIDDHGDVTIQYCPPGGCGYSTNSYAYLYDGVAKKLLPLARLGVAPVEQYTPAALNDSGQIAGWVRLEKNGQQSDEPVEWTRVGAAGSKITVLNTANPGVTAYAYGINANGEIVGAVVVGPYGTHHAVRFSGTTSTPLIAPSQDEGSDAFSVNGAGTATGDNFGSAAVFAPSGAYDINLGPGYTSYSNGVAITCAGDVYGNYTYYNPYDGQPNYPFGFIAYAAAGPGALANFIFYGDELTQITGANDFGFFVGNITAMQNGEQSGPYLGLPLGGESLLVNFIPPNAPFSLQSAAAINNAGQIVGQASAAGRNTVFEMAPVGGGPGQPAQPVQCRGPQQLRGHELPRGRSNR